MKDEDHLKTVHSTKVYVVVVLLVGIAAGYGKAKSVYHNILNTIHSESERIIDTMEAHHYNFDNSWGGEEGSRLLSHALGGIDGKTYTNSLEAFEANYALGHRVFEVDLDITDDYIMVGSHDSGRWRKMTGMKEDVPYSLENFLSTPLYDRYTPLDYRQIIDLLVKYPDVYLVTDTKYRDKTTVLLQFSHLVKYAQETEPEVLERIVPEIYTEEMIDWVMDIYPFLCVLFPTHYIDWSPQSIYEMCQRTGVNFISVSYKSITPECIELWSSIGVKTLVYTIDDSEEAQSFFDMGVDMVCSNFLEPFLYNDNQ